MEAVHLFHACLMDIALEIRSICEKHNIKFFLIGGTLLGAVRHQGIIPWDDDLDVGMLREDYERFLKVSELELKKSFILVTPEKYAQYGKPYAKVMIKDTLFEEETIPAGSPQGIFVDVFPIDRMPDSRRARLIQSKCLGAMRSVLHFHCGYSFQPVGMKDHFYRFLGKVLTKQQILNVIHFFSVRYNKAKTEWYANLCSSYRYGREIFPEESVANELDTVIFENQMMTVPKQKEKILQILYGDYMSPPPKEQQIFKHSTGSILFNHYQPYSINEHKISEQ